MRAAGLLALVLLAGTPAWAADPPRYVAGPASGLAYDCRQAGERVPAGMVVEITDVDGDGRADHLIDAGKGCAAVRALYCNDEGCAVDVFLSSLSGKAGGVRAQRVAVDRSVRPARLGVVQGGPACGKPAGETCSVTLRWNGSALEAVR